MPPIRLRSRKPSWIYLQNLNAESVEDKWKHRRNQAQPSNSHLIVDPPKKLEGFMLPRKDWVTLNRLRDNVGNC